MWAEGRAGWHPLQDVPELWAEASAAAVEAATAASGSEAAGTSAQKPSAPVAATASRPAAAVKAAKAVKADIKPADRELAAFQAEMSALGATDAPTADEDASLPDLAPGRVETPPPDERRFEDDDGTIFVWDALLRRFVEEVCTDRHLACMRACRMSFSSPFVVGTCSSLRPLSNCTHVSHARPTWHSMPAMHGTRVPQNMTRVPQNMTRDLLHPRRALRRWRQGRCQPRCRRMAWRT